MAGADIHPAAPAATGSDPWSISWARHGFTLEAEGEPSIYWTGDTVLYPPVADTIAAAKPDVIFTHSCGARWDGDLIVMDAAETVAVCQSAPWATVVAVHMEALDHATVSRADLRAAAEAAGIAPTRLLIPPMARC